jgi:hypothetical protein
MTAHRLGWIGHRRRIEFLVVRHPDRGVREIGRLHLHPLSSCINYARFNQAYMKFLSLGEVGDNSLFFACHGDEVRGAPPEGLTGGTTLAPLPARRPRSAGPSILVLLHGLTGLADGGTSVTQLVPIATHNDHWIASVLSDSRNSFGKEAIFITARDVATFRGANLSKNALHTHEAVKTFEKTAS